MITYNYKGRELKIISNSKKCFYGYLGFHECHCNECLDTIVAMDGINKNISYFLKSENMNVEISNFYPFENCMDTFWYKLPSETGKLFGCAMIDDFK